MEFFLHEYLQAMDQPVGDHLRHAVDLFELFVVPTGRRDCRISSVVTPCITALKGYRILAGARRSLHMDLIHFLFLRLVVDGAKGQLPIAARNKHIDRRLRRPTRLTNETTSLLYHNRWRLTCQSLQTENATCRSKYPSVDAHYFTSCRLQSHRESEPLLSSITILGHRSVL